MTGPSAPKTCATEKKNEMPRLRTSRGNSSLTVRYALEAPAEARKNAALQKTACVVAVSASAWNKAEDTSRMSPAPP